MHSTGRTTNENAARAVAGHSSISSFLINHGIKPTRQRVAIATHLFEKDQHLSADIILDKVNKDSTISTVSKATVYNTLKLFVDEGILREVAIDPERILFDTNTKDHHHILNVDTGEIRDIEPLQIDTSSLPELLGEKLDSVDLILKVRNQLSAPR